MLYELQVLQEGWGGKEYLWHISKPREKNMSQVIYYNNRQCKLYDTLKYRYSLWQKFVINTLIFENTVIKHYINIVSSGYLKNKRYQLQSSGVFSQPTSWSKTSCCLQSVLRATQKPTTPKTRQYNTLEWEKTVNISVSRSCPTSSMLTSDRAPMNTLHCNYLLLQ